MPNEKKDKLRRFVHDTPLMASVHSFLLRSYLKPSKSTDVHTLAASRIAIDLLEGAWKELAKLRDEVGTESPEVANIGV